jgi:hypothetical protein
MKFGKWIKPSLIFLLVASAIADIVTTVMATSQNYSISQRESNPIVSMLGLPLWGLFIFKMIVILWACYIFNKSSTESERRYYFFMVFMLFVTFVQVMASMGNYHVYENAEFYETQPIPSTEEMNQHYSRFIWLFMFLPMAIAFFPYLLFEWSYPYQKFKKRRLGQK